MHELGVTKTLLETVLQHAERAGAARVDTVNLVIGDLSSYVDESVQFYWDLITVGTPAEGSRLEFERVPAEFTCRTCGHKFAPDGVSFRCPQCTSNDVAVTGGQEFLIDSITVLDPEDLKP
jgi:hydrogenase nickel incorporation protein HypA/HybF